jgi:hypothetical protein
VCTSQYIQTLDSAYAFHPPSRAGSTHAHPCHVCAPAPTAIWVFPPCPIAHAHLQPHAQARQLGKRCRRASASSDLSFAHLVCAHPFSQSQPRGGNLASSVDGLASFDLLRISCAHTPPHRHKPKRGKQYRWPSVLRPFAHLVCAQAQAWQLGKQCRRASASSELSFAHLVCMRTLLHTGTTPW